MKKIVNLIIFSATILCLNACSKDHKCFDAALKKEYENKFCTQDCPGVVACNGVNYCNECIANTAGYKLK
jgi:hypothetical protein